MHNQKENIKMVFWHELIWVWYAHICAYRQFSGYAHSWPSQRLPSLGKYVLRYTTNLYLKWELNIQQIH